MLCEEKDMKITSLRSNKGFTIVELLIALSILSTILTMSTVIMIQIGKWYNKGVNAANIQNTSRNLTSDISSALQFSGSNTRSGSTSYGGTNVSAICIDTIRYSYLLNKSLGHDSGDTTGSPAIAASDTPHVIWRDQMKTRANCTPLNITTASIPADSDDDNPMTNGYEMVGNHMRLTKFVVGYRGGTSLGIVNITVNMAYGDSDVVINNGGTALCKGGTGSEYCNISNLTTSVKRRIE